MISRLVEWGFYALSASKAIFRARSTYCPLFQNIEGCADNHTGILPLKQWLQSGQQSLRTH